MSAVLAIASPRRIKAMHHRRRKVTLGPIVQRYYDPSIGRFLSIDPVPTDLDTGDSFNRYWYANNSPYRFTDPDGRISRSPNSRDRAALTSKDQFRQKVVDKVAAKVGKTEGMSEAYYAAQGHESGQGIQYDSSSPVSSAAGGEVKIGTGAFASPDMVEAVVVHELSHIKEDISGGDIGNEQVAYKADLDYVREHNLEIPAKDLEFIAEQAGEPIREVEPK